MGSVALILLSVLILWLLVTYLTYPESLKVEKVIDGDTAKTNLGKVRFLYIDAPELGKQKDWVIEETKGSEGCLRRVGLEAKEYLKRKLKEVKATVFKDKYGRILGYGLDEKGEIIGLNMVERGLALCYYRFPLFSLRAIDINAWVCLSKEEKAKSLGLGIWSCGET